MSLEFEVNQYEFSDKFFTQVRRNRFVEDLWPIVYILSDEKINEAYIGETTDTESRMFAHLKNNEKSKLTTVHLITSDKFNKSATLDIESNLIKYISGDGKYKLLNGNLGLANHNYFQKKEYWNIFSSLWDVLRTGGICQHSIEHINNSDLFKYSPYKSLKQDQRKGLIMIMECLLNDSFSNVVVEGGAGTGKTILAIFLFKILNTNNEDFNFNEFEEDKAEFITLINHLKARFHTPKMALVVPMSSFRTTLKKVFKNIKGLKSSMVIGPAKVAKNKYDILIVDEAHRLRRRVNLGAYFGAFDKACMYLGLDKRKASELDFVTLQAQKTILFYDEGQSIKPSDVRKESFDALKSKDDTGIKKLKSQFRVKGGNAYVKLVDELLDSQLFVNQKKYYSKKYDLLLFNSLGKMVERIKEKNKQLGLSRLIAGYSWEWRSNKDKNAYDIEIQGLKLKWNGTSNDWINSEKSIDEVGCIHTTQGYDLNYAGIIFGNEITFNKHTNRIEVIKENYHDKLGKQSISDPQELEGFILNIYKTIMLRGIEGTYIYACDDNLREYLAKSIEIADQTEELIITETSLNPYVNSVPLYDLEAAAGNFSHQQQVSDDQKKFIRVPESQRVSKDDFACKVVGQSMNKIIPSNSICLFSKYSGGSRNGLIVLAEHTEFQDSDSGSNYTVKEYHSTKEQSEEGWSHSSIILKPLSTDSKYEKLVLKKDDLIGFKVVGIFKAVISQVEE